MPRLQIIQTRVAIAVARLTAKLSKATGRGSGTSLPGKLAAKIDPTLFNKLCQQIPLSIVVTGTNGKSTTSGLIAAMLTAAKQKVAHNLLGANMQQGLLTALTQQSSFDGQLACDVGVLEIDEATLPLVAADVQQDVTVVTNLFRDQLDRFGELDTTAKLIQKGIQASLVNSNQAHKLVLNADDPIVTSIGFEFDQDDIVYFGLSDELGEQLSCRPLPELLNTVPFPREVTDCPKCQTRLNYQFFVYGHLGHYQCPSCGFERPRPHVSLESLESTLDETIFKVRHRSLAEPVTYHTHLRGRFNLYNVLGAMAGVNTLCPEINSEQLQSGLNQFKSIFGRSEVREIDGKRVEIYLIKNPMGAAEVLETVAKHRQRQCVIALNDKAADGKDVSWIWDAPFEWLAEDAMPIIVSGHRAEDMALRLYYAGLPAEMIQVISDPMAALAQATQQAKPDEVCFVLPTYTALLEISQNLKSR